MKPATVLQILSVLLMLAGCSPRPAGEVHSISGLEPIGAVKESGVGHTGVLEGSVLKGPRSALVEPGGISSVGIAGARVDIATVNGNPVISVKTDSTGNFRINLPAGTYKVTMPSLYGAMFTKDVPATVTIVPGLEQRLDIVLDTGIR